MKRINSLVSCNFLVGFLLLTVVAIGSKSIRGQESLSYPNLLILNSYHPGLSWSDNELIGVISKLRQKYPDLEPRIEYLDAKNFSSSDYWSLFKDFLQRKYQNQRFDLLIVLDNAAFDLAIRSRNELFPETPIVFSGVNNFQIQMLQDQEKITGVTAEKDIISTLKLALALHPKTQRILLIHDYSSSDLAKNLDLENLQLHILHPPDIAVTPSAPFTDLALRLRMLPDDSLVLLLVCAPIREPSFSNDEEKLRLIPKISPAPVYTVYAACLGDGVVGGMMLDGKEHGARVAEIALRVLAGEEPSHIPIVGDRSSPIFDGLALRRFQIPLSALPANSKIIHRPVSFYEENEHLVLAVVAVLTLLILLMIAQSLCLRHARLRITAMAFETQEGMMITNAEGVILRVNQAFVDITGYSMEEAVGQKPRLLKSDRHDAIFYNAMWAELQRNGVWRGEIWNRRKSGDLYLEYLTITAVKRKNGEVTHYVGALTDITQRKAVEDDIQRLAFFDPLTGLPNRRLLLDRLNQALLSSARSQRQGALLFIDLDRFKVLNDTLGHDIGDLLLQQVAQRLVACVREGDTVARLGGDEFVIMLKNLSTQSRKAVTQTQIVGEKILAALNQPYSLAGHWHHSTPSIGVTLISDHQNSIDELLKRADLALYQAKAAGRNTLRFFDPVRDKPRRSGRGRIARTA